MQVFAVSLLFYHLCGSKKHLYCLNLCIFVVIEAIILLCSTLIDIFIIVTKVCYTPLHTNTPLLSTLPFA